MIVLITFTKKIKILKKIIIITIMKKYTNRKIYHNMGECLENNRIKL